MSSRMPGIEHCRRHKSNRSRPINFPKPNVSQQVMKKVVTFQSIVSTCSQNLQSFSQPFIDQLSLYLPKYYSTEKRVNTYSSDYNPSQDELDLMLPLETDETFFSLQRVMHRGQTICTEEYNNTKATTTNNHCIRSDRHKYYIVKKIIKCSKSGVINLICCELIRCTKLPLNRNVSITNTNFMYIHTFSKISSKLTKLSLTEFYEHATYATIGNTNYVFNIFNKHL